MISKQDIRNRAFQIFAYNGFSETTTDKIARALGLKKQSLYSHYRSKNEILSDVLKEQTSIISLELYKTVNELRDSDVDLLLKGIFESLVLIFSNYERLLLWKRISINQNNEEYMELLRESDWDFIRKLYSDLDEIIGAKYPKFSDPDTFKEFFYTYLMVIQGYLDWMLLSSHNEQYFVALWQNYWNGIKHKFSA